MMNVVVVILAVTVPAARSTAPIVKLTVTVLAAALVLIQPPTVVLVGAEAGVHAAVVLMAAEAVVLRVNVEVRAIIASVS